MEKLPLKQNSKLEATTNKLTSVLFVVTLLAVIAILGYVGYHEPEKHQLKPQTNQTYFKQEAVNRKPDYHLTKQQSKHQTTGIKQNTKKLNISFSGTPERESNLVTTCSSLKPQQIIEEVLLKKLKRNIQCIKNNSFSQCILFRCDAQVKLYELTCDHQVIRCQTKPNLYWFYCDQAWLKNTYCENWRYSNYISEDEPDSKNRFTEYSKHDLTNANSSNETARLSTKLQTKASEVSNDEVTGILIKQFSSTDENQFSPKIEKIQKNIIKNAEKDPLNRRKMTQKNEIHSNSNVVFLVTLTASIGTILSSVWFAFQVLTEDNYLFS